MGTCINSSHTFILHHAPHLTHTPSPKIPLYYVMGTCIISSHTFILHHHLTSLTYHHLSKILMLWELVSFNLTPLCTQSQLLHLTHTVIYNITQNISEGVSTVVLAQISAYWYIAN